MNLDSIKNKEVRLNALSFQRRETGFDDAFMELVKLADRVSVLVNAELSFNAAVVPEDRATLLAAKMKFASIQREIRNLTAVLDGLGLDSKKVLKNLSDISIKKSEFSQKYCALDKSLPDHLKLPDICPYFTGFLEE